MSKDILETAINNDLFDEIKRLRRAINTLIDSHCTSCDDKREHVVKCGRCVVYHYKKIYLE